MPVFNGEEYIRDALDSLLAQTFTNFELIISDNASTDNTEQICRNYAARDARIRYVRQPKNLGAVANFRFVLDEAAGEYFMWAAHDDLWDKNFISWAISALSNSSAGFAFPTFTLKSIRLPLSKKCKRQVYLGFEDEDKSVRVLSFANLHQNSIKDMLIYSLFRLDILRKVFVTEAVSVGPVLCMLILNETRGVIMDRHLMFKRYRKLWPGFRRKLFLKPQKKEQFEKIRDERIDTAKRLFPDLQDSLELIRKNHKPSNYHSNYKILKVLPYHGAGKSGLNK